MLSLTLFTVCKFRVERCRCFFDIKKPTVYMHENEWQRDIYMYMYMHTVYMYKHTFNYAHIRKIITCMCNNANLWTGSWQGQKKFSEGEAEQWAKRSNFNYMYQELIVSWHYSQCYYRYIVEAYHWHFEMTNKSFWISLHCLQVYLHLVGGFFLFFSQSLSQFISLRILLLSPCWPIICFTERGRYLSTHNKLGSPKHLKMPMRSWMACTCICMY